MSNIKSLLVAADAAVAACKPVFLLDNLPELSWPTSNASMHFISESFAGGVGAVFVP